MNTVRSRLFQQPSPHWPTCSVSVLLIYYVAILFCQYVFLTVFVITKRTKQNNESYIQSNKITTKVAWF